MPYVFGKIQESARMLPTNNPLRKPIGSVMKILNILKEVKDNRHCQGKLYPLSALLAVIIVSRLCGYQDIKAAWHLCCSMHWKQKHQLGFRNHYTPSHPVFTEALRRLDVESLEAVLSKLSYDSLHAEEGSAVHLAIDGKALCGRKDEEGSKYHLVSLFCNKLSSVFGQVRSKAGGGEIASAISLVAHMDLTNKVISGDAMFARADLCQAIVDKGGDYVFTVKSNQQELLHELKQQFRVNPWPTQERKFEEEITKEHGRIEKRSIRVMNWHYSHHKNGFDTIEQVAEITRYRHDLKHPGNGSIEKAYIISSIRESQASPEMLLRYNKEHWGIENRLHRTRDMLFAEDKQTIRKGDSPWANSALSNLALALLNKHKKEQKSMSLSAFTQSCARKLSMPIAMLV